MLVEKIQNFNVNYFLTGKHKTLIKSDQVVNYIYLIFKKITN